MVTRNDLKRCFNKLIKFYNKAVLVHFFKSCLQVEKLHLKFLRTNSNFSFTMNTVTDTNWFREKNNTRPRIDLDLEDKICW